MKNWIATSLFILIAFFSQAQQITAQTYMQQTVMGVQKGFGLRMHQAKWGLGVVFQSTQIGKTEASVGNYPMTAIEGVFPVSTSGRLSFALTPKIGLVNERFLVFIPEVETNIKLTKFLFVGIGAGIRARQASTSVKLIFKTPKF